MTLALQIVVYVAAIDGFRTTRRFKTLEGAQRFAQQRVGATPELGRGYAVAGDGVVKVTVRGCEIADLFPALADASDYPTDAEVDAIMAAEAAAERAANIADWEARNAEWEAATRIPRPPGCTCSDHQMTHVGCACGAEETARAEAEGRVVVDSVWTCDIANPGVAPIWAVMVRAAGRDWALCDNRALFATQREAAKLAHKVRVRGSIKTDLWDPTTRTDAEREAYYGPGGDLWQWEEQEKAAGRW